jgi:hypothetical protein
MATCQAVGKASSKVTPAVGEEADNHHGDGCLCRRLTGRPSAKIFLYFFADGF